MDIKGSGNLLLIDAFLEHLAHAFTPLGDGYSKVVGICTAQHDDDISRVHDQTVMEDYFWAMGEIEGVQTAVLEPKPTTEKAIVLLNKLENDGMSAKQQRLLAELRRCLVQPTTTNQNQPLKPLLTGK